jgi:hypothetical protein
VSRVVRFYSKMKNFAQYDRHTTSHKFKDISRQLPASLVDVSGAPESTGG